MNKNVFKELERLRASGSISGRVYRNAVHELMKHNYHDRGRICTFDLIEKVEKDLKFWDEECPF